MTPLLKGMCVYIGSFDCCNVVIGISGESHVPGEISFSLEINVSSCCSTYVSKLYCWVAKIDDDRTGHVLLTDVF